MAKKQTLASLWDDLSPLERKYFLEKYRLNKPLNCMPWVQVFFMNLNEVIPQIIRNSCKIEHKGELYKSTDVWGLVAAKLKKHRIIIPGIFYD